MAIRTFTATQRYSRNRGWETEPRKKLKKLKSVKVANLDRLRLSMKREKSRFDWSSVASSDDVTDPSGSSSTPMSGTSSPNYMKATTSSSARKWSSRASSGTVLSSSGGSSDARTSAGKRNHYATTSRLDKVYPVENVGPKKSIKRVSSVKHAKKLSSMKIRAKYSQFQENSDNAEFTTDYEPGSLDANHVHDQESIVGDGDNQKSILKRSRSIKLTKIRSKRYSGRLQKSRFGVAAETMSTAIPHYMRGTSSHEARKISAKGLTRTSSWRPLRVLAKFPSLRPRTIKVRKRLQVTPLSRTGVDRATCSSTLKRTEFPDHIELLSGKRESEGASSVHICPYTYCSLNGHHHHDPPPPLKEFIAAKRRSLNNHKVMDIRKDATHFVSTPPEGDQSKQLVSTEIHAPQMVNSTPVEEDAGLDFLITIEDKPRKKWDVEGNSRSDLEALTGFTYNETSERDYGLELPEAPSKISQSKGRQDALNEGLQETHGIFGMSNVEADDETNLENSTTSSNGTTESLLSEETVQRSGDDLLNILSDKQKYTDIWHLIYRQFVSSDVSKTGIEEITGADEREVEGVDNHEGNELDEQYRKNLKEGDDYQEVATENPAFDQTAAFKLVQEGLNAILERDAESLDQQSKPDQDMADTLSREYTSTPEASTEENMALGEMPKKMNLIGTAMQQKVDPSEAGMPRQQMSKSYIKLRKIFVTAKIIKAMETMKRLSPQQPRYLPVESTSEGEKVYLRHLSKKERKNTEEWMLDYALRSVISKLGPDQQRRVAQLVEAFHTVTPGQKESIRHYPIKGKPIVTSNLAILINKEPEQTMSIPDEKVNRQQGKEICLREAHEARTRATDSPLEPSGDSGHSCEAVYTQFNDECMIKEPISAPGEPSQSPIEGLNVSHTDVMDKMFSSKQKYTGMWNLIYQHVASRETSMRETSMDVEQGANVSDEEEQGGKPIKCKDINDPDSTRSSYYTNPKEYKDVENATGEMNESDQSAAVKLVREALDAILKRFEQPSQHHAIPDQRSIASCTDESLGEDGNHVEKHANLEGEEKLHVEPKLENPPRQMSKSYHRLRKAFVTAKFIKAMQRLRLNSPRKTQSLPPGAGLKGEKVYLRHLSIDGRRSDEECMLDYALRQVISKMAPDQRKRVAQLVEAFERFTPQEKEKGIAGYPSENETATVARSATHTSVLLKSMTEKMHQRSISDEQDYQVPQNQDDEILRYTKGASREISLQEDHYHKAAPEGDLTQQNTVETARSQAVTFSQISQISTPANIETDISSIGIKETNKDAEVSSCFPTETSEVKSEGDITTILFDKQKYTSMWHLIHQEVISSEASKVAKQEINEIDEEERHEMNYPDSTPIRSMEQDKDIQSAVINQSAAIKLVKEAIHAILQRHEQRNNQRPSQSDDVTCDDAKRLCDTSLSSPTKEKSQEGKTIAEKHRSPWLEGNLHEAHKTSIPPQEQAEEKANQGKMSNSHRKLKRIFVTAKFIAAMERLKKNTWSRPRHIPPGAASVNEIVNLRPLSIDGRKNNEEWMLDYALRNVIANLDPDQQRKVALLVEAFETVTPERKGNGFGYQKKDEFSSANNSKATDEKLVDVEDNSMVNNGHCPKMQDRGFNLLECAPSKRNQEQDCQPNIPSIKTKLSSDAPHSDQINLCIHNQTNLEGCPVQDPLAMRKKADVNISKGQQNFEHNITKGVFSSKQKTNSMWHLICQHIQSTTAAEDESELSERLDNNHNNNHAKRDDTSFENVNDTEYDDNNSDASSVTSELTENDAIKLVKETIDDILEGPRELNNEFHSSQSTSVLEEDPITGQNPEKSLSTGYSKLRHLIICKKFIKTMQKTRKIHPQKQKIPALYSGVEAGKAHLKSNGAGEKKVTDEWMLDNVLQKVVSGLAPAKQRRVALLVEAFEKVNPDQEERGTGLSYMKKGLSDAISLQGNEKENGDTVFESSQLSSESPYSLKSKAGRLATISYMKLATGSVPRDICEGKTPSLTKEMEGDTPSKMKAVPSVAINTSSELRKDPIEVCCRDEQGDPPNEMRSVEKRLVEDSHQATKVAEKAVLPAGRKHGGNHITQNSTSLDKENTISLWGLILQHAETDIPEKEEVLLSVKIDKEGNSADEGNHNERNSTSLDKESNTSLWGLILQHINTDVPEKVETQLSETATEDNSENFSQFSPQGIQDKETPTSFELYESEAVKLVQEAVNELLTSKELGGNNESMSASTTSDQAVPNQVPDNGKETSSINVAQVETLTDTITTPEEWNSPPKESLSSTYSKVSRVIMCKKFIKAMNKMRELKPQPPREVSHTTQAEAKGSPSLRQTTTGEKKSWEEAMLDHALQKVVGKLGPAQKKRVSQLVQAFEAVGSQTGPVSGNRNKDRHTVNV